MSKRSLTSFLLAPVFHLCTTNWKGIAAKLWELYSGIVYSSKAITRCALGTNNFNVTPLYQAPISITVSVATSFKTVLIFFIGGYPFYTGAAWSFLYFVWRCLVLHILYRRYICPLNIHISSWTSQKQHQRKPYVWFSANSSFRRSRSISILFCESKAPAEIHLRTVHSSSLSPFHDFACFLDRVIQICRAKSNIYSLVSNVI